MGHIKIIFYFLLCQIGVIFSEPLNDTVQNLLNKIHDRNFSAFQNMWLATDATINGLSDVYPSGIILGKLATKFLKDEIAPNSDEYSAIKLILNLTMSTMDEPKNNEFKIEDKPITSDLKYYHFLSDYDAKVGIVTLSLQTGLHYLIHQIHSSSRWNEFCTKNGNSIPQAILDRLYKRVVVGCQSIDTFSSETWSKTSSYAKSYKFFQDLENEVIGLVNSSIYANYKTKILYPLSKITNIDQVLLLLKHEVVDVQGKTYKQIMEVLSYAVHKFIESGICWLDDILEKYSFKFDKVLLDIADITEDFQVIKIAAILCIEEIAGNKPGEDKKVLKNILDKSVEIHHFVKRNILEKYDNYFKNGKAVIDLRNWILNDYNEDLTRNLNHSAEAIQHFLENRGCQTYLFNVFITGNYVLGREIEFSCVDNKSCFYLTDIKETHIFISRHTFEYGRARRSRKYLTNLEIAIKNVLYEDFSETLPTLLNDIENKFPAANTINSYRALIAMHYSVIFGEPYKFGFATSELNKIPTFYSVFNSTSNLIKSHQTYLAYML